ncbi:MAG: nuclear transport factor 2 family protein [Terriglobales bacterium]
MKTMKIIAPVLVAICLLVVPLAWSQGGSVEQQITTLTDQLNQAFGKGDIGWMEKHFADDFTAIHSNGKLLNKAEEIDNVKTGNIKWATVDLHDRKIRAFRGTAVVTTLASSTGTVGGNPYSGDFRTTQVWLKQNGNWKMVAFQSTRVPPPSQ